MTVENGKIVEATVDELFEYFLKRGYDDIMSFQCYVNLLKKAGAKIADK